MFSTSKTQALMIELKLTTSALSFLCISWKSSKERSQKEALPLAVIQVAKLMPSGRVFETSKSLKSDKTPCHCHPAQVVSWSLKKAEFWLVNISNMFAAGRSQTSLTLWMGATSITNLACLAAIHAGILYSQRKHAGPRRCEEGDTKRHVCSCPTCPLEQAFMVALYVTRFGWSLYSCQRLSASSPNS